MHFALFYQAQKHIGELALRHQVEIEEVRRDIPIICETLH